MVVNGYYKIIPPLFCPNITFGEDRVIQISPNLWSRLDNAIGKSTEYFSSHSNHTFNPSWVKEIPTLVNKKYEPGYIPDPPLFWNYSTHGFMIGLLAFQSVLMWIAVIALFCIYCKSCKCYIHSSQANGIRRIFFIVQNVECYAGTVTHVLPLVRK